MENIKIEGLYNAAYRAYSNISFDPEKRAAQTVKDYEAELNEDMESMPEAEQERYTEGYKKHLFAFLSAKSRTLSSMITGPANFPVARNQKALNAEHARFCEFTDWRDKALKSIAKRIEQNKPEAQKKSETWERLESSILDSAATIHGINTGIERGYNKALFVSSIYKKVEVFAKKGDFETVQLAIDCIRHFNETMSVVITERHKFFKLAEQAKIKKETIDDRAQKENQEHPIIGGTVIFNYSMDRLQILFDEKPTPEIITSLKRYAFKWAPSASAWQRQLTGNAIFSTKCFLKDNNLFIK